MSAVRQQCRAAFTDALMHHPSKLETPMLLYDILLKAQAEHVIELAKTPNDYWFGAQSFLDHLALHDGTDACVEDLLGGLDIDEQASWATIEGYTWDLRSIAPAILYVIDAEND